MNRTKVLSN